jgi:hypothetical protein
VLPLKGSALGQAAYGDTGLREVNDVDLLVAPDAACGHSYPHPAISGPGMGCLGRENG